MPLPDGLEPCSRGRSRGSDLAMIEYTASLAGALASCSQEGLRVKRVELR